MNYWLRLDKNTKVRIVVYFLIGVAVVNIYPAKNIIDLLGNHYVYITKQGQLFEEWQLYGSRFEEAVEQGYRKHKMDPIYKEDSVLYRTVPISVLKFWRWNDYLTHPRWKLPFNSEADTLPTNTHAGVAKHSLSNKH